MQRLAESKKLLKYMADGMVLQLFSIRNTDEVCIEVRMIKRLSMIKKLSEITA